MTTPGGLLAARGWSTLIKQLDSALQASPQPDHQRAQLLLNRGLCFQQLGLLRKALKVRRYMSANAGDSDPACNHDGGSKAILGWRARCALL